MKGGMYIQIVQTRNLGKNDLEIRKKLDKVEEILKIRDLGQGYYSLKPHILRMSLTHGPYPL
jgi:hypothetical protein